MITKIILLSILIWFIIYILIIGLLYWEVNSRFFVKKRIKREMRGIKLISVSMGYVKYRVLSDIEIVVDYGLKYGLIPFIQIGVLLNSLFRMIKLSISLYEIKGWLRKKILEKSEKQVMEEGEV